ncbi:MAG TPA: hypothetical protein VJ724_05040, partial [Tahibacter sp.]|nr:hypothetical protein [Tahibacter sp.]
ADQSAALTVGTPLALNLAKAGQNGRFTFSGTAGQLLGLQVANLATSIPGQMTYFRVRDPDGIDVPSGSVNLYASAQTSFTNLALPAKTGTYTLFVDPALGATAAATIKLVAPVTGTLNTATSTNVTIPNAGQSAYLTFNGNAGDRLGVGLTAIGATPSGYLSISVNKPDGSLLTSASCYTPNARCDVNLPQLAVGGTYTLVATPSQTMTASFVAHLSNDQAGTLATGSPFALNLSVPGQNGRLTFAGTAGQRVGLRFSGLTIAPAGQTTFVRIFDPDGSPFGAQSSVNVVAGDTFVNLTLPQKTGTYVMTIDPQLAGTVTASVTLFGAAQSSVAIGGSTTMSTGYGGQVAYVTFNGTAGQKLGIGLTNVSASSAGSLSVYVNKPDENYITTSSCYSPNQRCDTNVPALPATATYTVVVVPSATTTMSFTLTLAADQEGTLALGSPIAMNLAAPGQNGRFTFAGSASQQVTIGFAGLSTTPAGQSTFVRITTSSGSSFSGSSPNLANGTTAIPLTLPANDTYTIFVDPQAAATATATISLTSP